MDSRQSKQFATMSFVSAILIVALHSLGVGNDNCCFRWLYRFVHDGLCLVAIPWFFFASGFFAAGHIHEEGWWRRAIFKRVRTLLVPFWVWSMVCFAFYVSIAVIIHQVGYDFKGEDALEMLSLKGLLRVLGLDWYDTMNTMWYLRTLFVFVCLSPTLLQLRLAGIAVLFLFSCLFYVYPPNNADLLQLGNNLLSVRGLFYFSFGLWCRSINFDLNSIPMKLTGGLSLLLCCANMICIEAGNGFRWFGVLQLLPLMIFVFQVCCYFKIRNDWLSLSFPIYVIHMMIVFLITGIYAVCGIGGYENMTFIKGLIRFGVSVILAAAIGKLIKAYFPMIAKVVFGGR